jgi:hypothetical protein
MKRLIIASLAIATLSTAAFAQSSTFWIVREGPTGKCMVVDRKPTDTKMVIVGGDGQVYTTRAEAEKQLTVVCK